MNAPLVRRGWMVDDSDGDAVHVWNESCCGEEGTTCRPVVMLELKSPPSTVVAHLRRGATEAAPFLFSRMALNDLADQIEAQTKPPKPAEPTGLGAVVEDAEGVQWVKIKAGRGTNWRQANAITPGRFLLYADIDAVRVLSEGVPSE